MNSITDEAIAVIGTDKSDSDWELKPKTHIQNITDTIKAGALVRILESPEIGEIISKFNNSNEAAKQAQSSYKKWGRLGVFATLAATLIGAIFLLPWQEWTGSRWIENINFKAPAVVLQYFVLGLVFLSYGILYWKKYYITWQTQRGIAETSRVAIFDKVMDKEEPAREGEMNPLPLKLEYFRRYQFDIQRSYYKERGEQHASAASRSKGWRLFSWSIYAFALFIAVPSIVAIAFNFFDIQISIIKQIFEIQPFQSIVQTAHKSLLAIGVMTSAIHAAAMARTRMDFDERNSARYNVTSKNLEYLYENELDTARTMASSGDEPGVLKFVSRVQRQISSEHQEWVLLAKTVPDVSV